MKTLYITIDTYCALDLSKVGLYKYAESTSFDILLIAYSEDGKGIKVVDIASGERIPEDLKCAIFDDSITKVAHNANFERVCLSSYFGRQLSAKSWRCTAAQCARMGLPRSLSGAAVALGLKEPYTESKRKLMNIFCTEHTPSKGNGFRSRVKTSDAPNMWQQFKSFSVQDLCNEIAIDKATAVGRAVVPFEAAVQELDSCINDKGVYIDRLFVDAAVKVDGDIRDRLFSEARRLTGLDNPCSSQQLTAWLSTKGIRAYTLSAASVDDMITRTSDKDVKRVLEIRKQLAKTSTSKYSAMLDVVCSDGRARGLFQYYGTLTGRWSSCLVQLHNLPRNGSIDIEAARAAITFGDVDAIELEFGNVSDVLAQMIRAAFVAPEGKTFVVCDYSAIEARVLSWLAAEEWRLEVFRTHGKIYEATAAKLHGVDIEEITHGDPRRKHGKVAELSLGYQGGVAAMKGQAAKEGLTLSDEQIRDIVLRWREANKKIVELWSTLERTLQYIVANNSRAELPKGMTAEMIEGTLYVTLPSGRYLAYPGAKVSDKKVVYAGKEDTYLYGGKIAENICQAIARDCLAAAMLEIQGKYGDVVAHVHDEVVVEVDEEKADEALKGIVNVFSVSPSWAKGLPLTGEAFISKCYRK